jgi:hypothetical protein
VPARNFYISQMIKMAKTRDLSPIVRFARRRFGRRARGG